MEINNIYLIKFQKMILFLTYHPAQEQYNKKAIKYLEKRGFTIIHPLVPRDLRFGKPAWYISIVGSNELFFFAYFLMKKCLKSSQPYLHTSGFLWKNRNLKPNSCSFFIPAFQ